MKFHRTVLSLIAACLSILPPLYGAATQAPAGRGGPNNGALFEAVQGMFQAVPTPWRSEIGKYLTSTDYPGSLEDKLLAPPETSADAAVDWAIGQTAAGNFFNKVVQANTPGEKFVIAGKLHELYRALQTVGFAMDASQQTQFTHGLSAVYQVLYPQITGPQLYELALAWARDLGEASEDSPPPAVRSTPAYLSPIPISSEVGELLYPNRRKIMVEKLP